MINVGYVNEYLLMKVKKTYHDHITGKYIGADHSNCNINLKLTKNFTIIFHNLRAYDDHLIMQAMNKFNEKTNVIPNELEVHGFCD